MKRVWKYKENLTWVYSNAKNIPFQAKLYRELRKLFEIMLYVFLCSNHTHSYIHTHAHVYIHKYIYMIWCMYSNA